MLRVFLLLFFNIALLSACQEPRKEKIPISNITIQIGEQGHKFVKRYPGEIKTERQPAGLDFYKIGWPASKKGEVTIENGKHSFALEDVRSVVGTQSNEFPTEGISEWNITVGVTGPNGIYHDDARKTMFAILQKFLQAGWKVSIPLSVPRLRGKEMTNYLLKEGRYTTLDAEYTPTLEEWMQIDSSGIWKLYADRMFLKVTFMRESTLTDLTKPSSYIFSFDLTSETETFRSYVEGEDRAR